MPKKTNLQEKFANSISAISAATSLVRKTISKQTSKKLITKKVAKPNASKTPKSSLISKVRKLINNPILQTIGQNIIEISTQSNLSIYTHNICWTQSKTNHIRIAEKIQTLEPDIVCLQEVVFQNQCEIFNLPKYHKSVAASSGERIVKGGLAIFSKKEPLSVNFIKFEKQGRIFSQQLAERQLEKGFLVAEFEDYLIVNTHLTSPHSKSTVDTLKVYDSQVQQILLLTKNVTKQLFLVGDLCFTNNSDKFKNIIKPNFIDLTVRVPYTFLKWKTKNDFILSIKSVTRHKSRAIRFTHQEPSDHLALFSQIVY
jgi:endonuclease/exonuclease/phosphatase family metal-dependent hydrolase